MGGHSAAAGHGNHFTQSYTMQLQRIMEPVFARLGVHFEAHNMAMGGLGTVHNAIAAGDIYGKEIDILMWDSSMTEKKDSLYDVFARQGLISGNRVPILWSGIPAGLKRLYVQGSAEVGNVGGFNCCKDGLPATLTKEQALELPWGARYVSCDHTSAAVCAARENKYNATCWIDRPDYTPTMPQEDSPDGQASWHPGSRSHQLVGRALGFAILQALRDGLQMWKESEDYILPDDVWHVTSHYENTRAKVLAMQDDDIPCLMAPIPQSFCRSPVNGRSEFLPRVNPLETSIRSILYHGGYFPEPEPNVYEPPDVFIPNIEVPFGAGVDYLNIVENGVDYVPNRSRRKLVAYRKHQVRRNGVGFPPNDAIIKPSDGWSLDSKSAGDFCDGTYDSFCGRSSNSKCLLYGHNDHRGGLWLDGLSGWMVMKLEKVVHGSILVKIEHWHGEDKNPR